MCYDNSVIHFSQLVDANKKADVDVDFTMSRPAG